PVLRADVVALAVLRRRIVDLVEPEQQLLVRRDARVEHDLHRLGVAGVAVRDLVLRRARLPATDVAGLDRRGTVRISHPPLDAPEAAARDDRGLARAAGGGCAPWLGIGDRRRARRQEDSREQRACDPDLHDLSTSAARSGYRINGA